MAKIDVIMPQMGESIAEGTLSRWMKKLGDEVKRDEPIFEISTDKVDAEIPSPSAGVLAEILVQEGQTVAVQTVVARIETEKGASTSAPAAAAPAPSAPPAPVASPAPAATRPPAPAAAPAPAPATAPSAPSIPVAATQAPNGDESAEERLRRRSTPLVRKMVAEHNLDLATIPGTGFAGRVTKSDVLGYLEAPQPTGAPTPAPSSPAGRSAAQASAPSSAPGADPWPGDRVEPWSRIRKLTAEHMIMSQRVSAQVSSYFDIDYTHVARLRGKMKKEYAERGVNLTYLAFVVKAIAESIRKHPVVNAAVSSEATIYRNEINIGIAVALDWGLIVPVIKHADELSLLGIARAINDLGERARGKKLNPDDVQRGTFTITNPGVFGGVIGFPIINQPQVAILGVGGISKQPAVITLPDGTDVIAIRTRGILSMTYDHRVVDGADADRFLADVKKTLETFPENGV
ncbi:MAG: 2-oxoglutarate dehydrogenase, E2 component, dihydrolipoamide succinyltransferase [Gemmatimonadota bacterium]